MKRRSRARRMWDGIGALFSALVELIVDVLEGLTWR